jgi:hypothetical protein
LFCFLKYDLFWKKFHGLLRKRCIMLVLDEILCRCLLSTLGLWCHLILRFVDFFVWMAYLLVTMEYWSITLSLFGVCVFKSSSDCLINLGTLTLGHFLRKSFFYFFTLSQCLFLSVRWVSYKQRIIGSSFLSRLAICDFWCMNWDH